LLRPVARIKLEKCVGCGSCIKMCPVNAIELIKGKAIVIDPLCIGCLLCVRICQNGAIYPDYRFSVKTELENMMIKAALLKRKLSLISERIKSLKHV